MKAMIIVILLLLAGCSSYVPLEQLESEALMSGDWSRVEQRERMIARRNSRSFMNCPPGTMGYCQRGGVQEKCGCVDRDIMRQAFVSD